MLGGSQVATDVNAMRAARLARLAEPSVPASSFPTMQPQPASPPDRMCDVEPAFVAAASKVCDPQTMPLTSGLASSFACMPEGALLRIAAMLDLQSGLALATACSAAGETTTPAVSALRQAIERAKQEHHEAVQAIEQERAESHHQRTAEQEAHAAALAALEPLRNDRHQARLPQLAQVFSMLEEAAAPSPGVTAEMEEALAARMAVALGALHANEASARAHIADGELRAALLHSHAASPSITA